MKNGFTLVELLGVIVVLAIVSGLAVVGVSSIVESGKKGVYKSYENDIKSAAENYYMDNISELPNEGNDTILSLTELVNGNYLDKFIDPNNGDCSSSYVKVIRGNDIMNNFNLEYEPCIICKINDKNTYKSSKCE